MISSQIFRSIRFHFARANNFRLLSQQSATNNCRVEIDKATGVALATLQKGPANALDLEFFLELTSTISKLENDAVRGVIITSGCPRIFSGGLNLFELYNAKRERAAEFWRAAQEFWIKLYMTRLVTIAAINGNCPAGGCLIAISCDHRVMASGNYTIGLNETAVGMIAPPWFMDTMKNTIGHRQAEKALQLGYLFTADEALEVGLVDEVVKEEDVVNAARKEMNKWLKISDVERLLTKVEMRREAVERLTQNRDKDVKAFLDRVMQDHFQKQLGLFVERLKNKKDRK